MDISTQESFRGLFIPYRLQMVLSGEEGSHFGPATTPESENTYLHETVHWWQTSMTGFGHASWSIFRQLTGYLVGEWIEATNHTPSQRVFSIHALTETPTKEYIKLFVARKTCESVLALAAARQSAPSRKNTVEELADNPLLTGKTWTICPTIEFGGRVLLLQGIDVIEAHAHLVATQYSANTHGIQAETFSELSTKYWIACAWFASRVGQDKLILFCLVCDLALMTIWNDSPGTEEEWQASCPAWRFVKLTGHLSGLEIAGEWDPVKDYVSTADWLLSQCGYVAISEVIQAALARSTWRLPLMKIEERIFSGMRFRQNSPWFVAYPLAEATVLHGMLRDHAVPSIQIQGNLRLNNADEGQDAADVGNEISGELMFQAWALQLLGVPSNTAGIPGTIQCGFRYFDVQNVCPHQIQDNCTGSFVPAEGSPYPINQEDEDGNLGCPFEKLLWASGVRVTDIKLP